MDEHGAEHRATGQVTCPSCGAPADSGQLVCLECGGRIALDYRRPFGWKLPLAIITVMLVLTGGGFAYALGEIEDDAESEVAKVPARETAASKGEGKRRKAGGGRKRGRDGRPRTAKRRAPPRVGDWPAGRDGFTVALVSTEDRAKAISVTRDVRRRGNRAGYLRSDDFSSLEPGFWIVFSGVYRTRSEADRAATRISRAFPGAFPQFVNGARSSRSR